MTRYIAYRPLYPSDFPNHLAAMLDRNAEGINFVIDEATMHHGMQNVSEMRQFTESKGLKTMASPWRVAGLFSGEAVTEMSGPGWELEDRETLFRLWCRFVSYAGFQHVMLDEPRVASSELIPFCSRAYRFLQSLRLRVTVCLSDDSLILLNGYEVRNFPCDQLSVGVFMWGAALDEKDVETKTSVILDSLTRRPGAMAWVQLFDLPDGREWVPGLVYDIAREAYALRDFGLWAFRACEDVVDKRPANYHRVWDDVARWYR